MSGGGGGRALGLIVGAVAVRLGGQVVVDRVGFSVLPGEIFGLMGANGAGKSSLFRYLAGLVPGEGRVSLGGVALDGLPLHARARAGLAYVPQGASVFPALTVRENLLAVAELRLAPGERAAAVDGALARFGLTEVAGIRAGAVSGGERRRLEVGRALLPGPSCLILDEPFAALDPRSVSALQTLLVQLAGEGLAIVLADHRVEAVLGCAHRGMVLHRGRAVAEGSPQALRGDPEAMRLYFGG